MFVHALKLSLARHFAPQKLMQALVGYLILCSYLVPTFITGEYIYYRWIQSPLANVVYYSVEPQKDAFKPGEHLAFFTDREVKHSVALAYNDRVFCYNENKAGWELALGYASENQNPKVTERALIPWNYPYEAPDWATLCHNVSQVTEKRPYGIRYRWEWQSRDFLVNQPVKE